MEAALREVPVSPSLFLAAELACRNLSISGSDRRRGLPRHISNALASAFFSLLTGRGSRAERLCVTLLMRRTQYHTCSIPIKSFEETQHCVFGIFQVEFLPY